MFIIINFCLKPIGFDRLFPVDYCLVHNKGFVWPNSYCFIPALDARSARLLRIRLLALDGRSAELAGGLSSGPILRQMCLSRESIRDLLHCRRTLYAKSHSTGVIDCYSEPRLVLLQLPPKPRCRKLLIGDRGWVWLRHGYIWSDAWRSK